jgi:hypothetical protein
MGSARSRVTLVAPKCPPWFGSLGIPKTEALPFEEPS